MFKAAISMLVMTLGLGLIVPGLAALEAHTSIHTALVCWEDGTCIEK